MRDMVREEYIRKNGEPPSPEELDKETAKRLADDYPDLPPAPPGEEYWDGSEPKVAKPYEDPSQGNPDGNGNADESGNSGSDSSGGTGNGEGNGDSGGGGYNDPTGGGEGGGGCQILGSCTESASYAGLFTVSR